MEWYVYIILCSDNSLYTGVTTDMERRFRQHAEGKGAKYFRGRQPVRVVYLEGAHSRSSAASREIRIKAMDRTEKLVLISGRTAIPLSLNA
ncbi:GIY-YIG nuclease family protein [Oryzomonas sagensis]|uniref:GIY-YIG nuclease family protein n=1 Tax=Oryzomonas sagensis TaxID=2603857 RepID=A0ABQ6TP63_9BACT|nr:GIY-YIG nuclease family protein [Oryzomonas sagensis]KAB0669903.1 GIY-YIG nuclease family protein [Oryzomonas sagensis]